MYIAQLVKRSSVKVRIDGRRLRAAGFSEEDIASLKNICDTSYKAGWDAATTAANVRSGDESNEAEKEARRKVALDKIGDAIQSSSLESLAHLRDELDAIIKVAQG